MKEKIKEAMSKAFIVPIESINEDSCQDNIETWDSIHHVRMIVYLERTFGISIPDEMVGNMISYKLIEKAIHECTGA